MGGLWCDYEANAKGDLVAASPKNQSTNVPGLYAGGEVDYAYHGGNRLGANSLLSCIYAGMIGGPAMASYAKAQKKSLGEVPSSVFDRAKAMWEERFQSIFKMQGTENPWGLHKELADTLTRESTVVKTNAGLKKADEKVRELQERWKNINVLDTGRTLNQTASFVNQLWNMFEMGRINLVCSIMRDECRGSHYKPEFDLPASKAKDPREDAEYMKAWLERDKKWRKTTIAEYAPEGPRVSYREIETPILKPEPRFYT
jgi:succinate dehydrogenase / fumarate reductase flavoprotein subunit